MVAFAAIGCAPDDVAPVEGPKLSVKPERVTLTADANSYASMTITTNADKVTATPKNDWLKADVMGQSLIITALTANESTTAARKGTVELTAGTAPATTTIEIEVEQSAKAAVTQVSFVPASITLLNSIGDSMDVTVSTAAFTVNVPAADQAWLEAVQNGAVVTFKVKELNPATEVRTSQVVFNFTDPTISPASQTYQVSQAAATPEPEIPEGNPLLGTAYDKDGVKGVIFWVDPNDATKAKIVSTQCYGPQNWCNSGFETVEIATTEDDGKANMAAIAAAAGDNIAEFLSYQSCKTEGEGWYMPSRAELDQLLKGYYNVTSFDAIYVRPSEMIESEAGKAAIAARDKFEAAMIGLGGVKLNQLEENNQDGTTYMGSTVNTANTSQVAYACTGRPRTSNAAKVAKSPKRYTRCIMEVTLPADK